MIERIYEPKVYKDKYIKNKSGIYQIRNLVNGKLYIGKSVDLYTRRYEHFRLLKNNEHYNYKLQRSYNKYDRKNYIFEVIEFIEDESKLLEHEQYWMDRFNVVEEGYNLEPIAGGLTTNGKPIICLENLKIYKSCLEAERFTGSDNSHILRCCKGIYTTVNGLHWMFYEDYCNSTQEQIVQILATKTNHGEKEVYCIELNKKFNSISEAKRFFNLKGSNLSSVCNGKQKTFGGYHWMYYKDYLKSSSLDIENLLNNKNTLNHNAKKVRCIETNIEYDSCTEAGKAHNINRKNIANVCNGKTKTALGLHWEFVL